MRASTKLKRILDKNTIGLSMSLNEWSMTIIDERGKRKQIDGKSFSQIMDAAYKMMNSEQKVKECDASKAEETNKS